MSLMINSILKYDINFKKPHPLYTTIRNFFYHLFKKHSKDLNPCQVCPLTKIVTSEKYCNKSARELETKKHSQIAPKIKTPNYVFNMLYIAWSGLLFISIISILIGFLFFPSNHTLKDKQHSNQQVSLIRCP